MRNWLLLAGGALVTAVGINGFIVANQLAEGGVGGISVLIHYFTGLPVGVLFALLNGPLLVLAWLQLGRAFALKTLVGIVLMSTALTVTAGVRFPMDDLLLASLYAGVVIGVGVGLMIRSGGSSGGTDVIAVLLKQRFGIAIGETYLIFDGLVLAAAGLLLGASTAMYALVITFISGRLVDYVQEGPNRAKAAFIITGHSRAVADVVIQQFGRGVTFLEGEGAYTGAQRQVLMTVLNRRELTQLKALVHNVDRSAFVIITNVAEVLGEGFTFPPPA